ncbi:uncharacterized protein LOC131686117 isoform X2 [Topomyia yanbarensis]|nr:uncharacterized protein LOC131686117 isoform X2 [Topomyia yanbarensis]
MSSPVRNNASIRNNNSVKIHKKDSSKLFSKNYFQDLLNRYKTYSPYYKDHFQADPSKMTKSLSSMNGKCNGGKCRDGDTKEELDEYDYEYEEEDDDDEEDDGDDEDEYDNTETQGDAGYITTTSSSVYAAVSSKVNRQSTHNKQSHGRNKHDNSIRRDMLVAIPDKDDLPPHLHTHLRNDLIHPVTEGRKIEYHRTDPSRLASHHATKIRREGSCSLPKPKIILASNDPTKQYTPHCTILHRCGDDVGCCLPTQTCAASKNSTVELYFFVHAVGSRSSIERLSFVNHTECSCINRHETINLTSIPTTSTASPAITASVCTCPSLFHRVIDNDNRCYCDCSSSDTQCDQFKRGQEHFSMENRRCIKDGRCEEPVCEYGHYNKAKGKCPTREDKLSYSYKG